MIHLTAIGAYAEILWIQGCIASTVYKWMQVFVPSLFHLWYYCEVEVVQAIHKQRKHHQAYIEMLNNRH